MNKPETLQAVVAALQANGHEATLEYPGYISIAGANTRFDIGTANGPWGIDAFRRGDDSAPIKSLITVVPGTCEDVVQIVTAIELTICGLAREYHKPCVACRGIGFTHSGRSCPFCQD